MGNHKVYFMTIFIKFKMFIVFKYYKLIHFHLGS